MSPTRLGLAVVVALALQTSIAGLLTASRGLDLLLLVVIYASLTSGPLKGLWVGALGGIAQDALSGGIVGVGGLAKTVVGFAVGVAGRQFIVDQPAPRFVVFAAGTVLHAAVFLGLYGVLVTPRVSASAGMVVSQAIANGVVGVVAFRLIEWIPRAVERARTRRLALVRRPGHWEAG